MLPPFEVLDSTEATVTVAVLRGFCAVRREGVVEAVDGEIPFVELVAVVEPTRGEPPDRRRRGRAAVVVPRGEVGGIGRATGRDWLRECVRVEDEPAGAAAAYERGVGELESRGEIEPAEDVVGAGTVRVPSAAVSSRALRGLESEPFGTA